MKKASSREQSSDDSSESDIEEEPQRKCLSTNRGSSQFVSEEADSRKKRGGGLDFEALSRHGYRGGPSVLKMRPPSEGETQDWSWSNGKKETPGTFQGLYLEREHTRAAANPVTETVQMSTPAAASLDKKSLSFKQREKRKRDLGQASRGKNYVEEEKRLLRDRGVYSGFDS